MTILKTENLTRHFGGLAALDHVNMEIRENEILGIIGPNGAGKTTFINVIAGIYLPTQGKIFFDNQDITEIPAHKRCRLGIARTFQLVRPLPGLSLLENVMVGSLFGKGLGQREAQAAGIPQQHLALAGVQHGCAHGRLDPERKAMLTQQAEPSRVFDQNRDADLVRHAVALAQ